MNLSPHFTLAELTGTGTGLPNTPGSNHIDNLRLLAGLVLEPLRVLRGGPLKVTSGYRSPEVNAAIKGSRTSDHMAGEAADLRGAADLIDEVWAVAHMLPLKQVIAYAPGRGGHLHVSIDLDAITSGEEPRRQFLFAPEGGGYRPWEP